MRNRLIAAAGLIFLLALAALVCSCGGGGGGGGAGPTTGVSGFVVDATSLHGIGGMVVMVGGATGTSTTPDGAFFVPAAAGTNQAVTVQPSALFVQVPGATVRVDVWQGQVTTLSGPLYVIDPSLLPPEPESAAAASR